MIFKTIDLGVEDAVWVRERLFVKTPDALDQVLTRIRNLGYNIEEQARNEFETPQQWAKASQWYASLYYGKCGSCNAYISRRGIAMHGHTCESCGAVTHYDAVDGTIAKFEFKDSGKFWPPVIHMEVARLDTQEGYLYLKYKFLDYGELYASPIEAANVFSDNSDKWELVEEDERLIKIRYTNGYGADRSNDPIEVRDFMRGYSNYETVQVWRGKEYGEHDELPVLDSFSIHEAWHWAPLKSSPTLHDTLFGVIGCHTRLSYYGGSHPNEQYWQKWQLDEMSKFVQHFTALDYDKWCEARPGFRLDGPGFIEDVANFCHRRPVLLRH